MNINQTVEPSDRAGLEDNSNYLGLEQLGEGKGGGGGGAVLSEEEMFVKTLPGQTRHCGILPSHEQSFNPDKDTRVRGERRD